ncbi:MAG: bifunctional hydroxymethylpyrimidine kinase/phosphomethylpyrimidine kinase [Nevskiaceae bacterium]|nr:MAG: bifunctional hydroxymethylpyrimidine kinase/phosphomethylpyrimidine kinase [Nevskiaceae bacterium]TBR73165.1 MAG: bifunctional hydroxymethylpyrimidine kinase/phosphomethylpyrimidine kinase [Nevskiaceae bacterium]
MQIPNVLCISGFDPSGGAGMQADIESCAANGTHALGIVTALTAQNTRNAVRVEAVAPAALEEQLDVLLADCRPAAIKIGLIGSAGQIPLIVRTIRALQVPVVCDPVLRAGGGATLLADATAAQLAADLFPHVTVITPNAAEARRLVPAAANLPDAARQLGERAGCAVLVTGGDEATAQVEDWLHLPNGSTRSWREPRVAGHFHGAGCTLSSAIAARLARGEALADAIGNARAYVHTALSRALQVGGGRLVPGRFA